jgi:hypothetical protein
MGQCCAKQKLRSVMPFPSNSQIPVTFRLDSPNITKRRIKRTRSRILQDAITPAKFVRVGSRLFIA